MKKRVMVFLVTMFLLVSGSFADTETLVIDAIIPGDSTSGDSPVHSLFVQDLFLQNQNLIANGEKIDIGQGSALFGNTPVPLFVVRHVTNSTEPMIISVKVSPFICTNTDGTTSVLSTNVQSQAGLDAYLSDIESLFASESYTRPQSFFGSEDSNPGNPVFSGSGARLRILNGVNIVLDSYNADHIVANAESSPVLDEESSKKVDSYSFQFEMANSLNGRWSFDEDTIWGVETGWGTWTWITESVGYTTNSTIIPGGFITEYVEYSVNITDENIPTDGKYVMNVKVSLSTDQ